MCETFIVDISLLCITNIHIYMYVSDHRRHAVTQCTYIFFTKQKPILCEAYGNEKNSASTCSCMQIRYLATAIEGTFWTSYE